MEVVYIALGSNLETPIKQLKSALVALNQLPATELLKVSSFYQSKPLGPQDQPDYVNAVACLKTELAPLILLDYLQTIEQEQGRIRLRRWGERTLDLDILLYGTQVIQSDRLIVPHYDMYNREFVIIPLYEICQTIVFPDGTLLKDRVKKFLLHQMKVIH